MATVRMTQELRQYIKRKAEWAFDLATPKVVPSKEVCTRLVAAINAAPMMTKLKEVESIVKSVTGKDVTFFGLQNINIGAETESSVTVDYRNRQPDGTSVGRRTFVDFDPAIVLTSVKDRYSLSACHVSTAFFTDDERAFFDAELSRIEQLNLDRDAKRRTYMETIIKLVEGCNTYKQLLEAWPQVTAFTPQDVLDKHNAKPEKRSRAQTLREDLELDTAQLNGVAVKAKLTGQL